MMHRQPGAAGRDVMNARVSPIKYYRLSTRDSPEISIVTYCRIGGYALSRQEKHRNHTPYILLRLLNYLRL